MKYILLVIIVTTFFSCFKSSFGENNDIQVYKTKKDYSKNISANLSDDGTRITGHPTSQGHPPLKLANGYWLNGMLGSEAAILDITYEEYHNADPPIGVDSLNKLIIDKDPFISFYLRDDYNQKFWIDGEDANGVDTAKINDLIREGKLEKYFEKLK